MLQHFYVLTRSEFVPSLKLCYASFLTVLLMLVLALLLFAWASVVVLSLQLLLAWALVLLLSLQLVVVIADDWFECELQLSRFLFRFSIQLSHRKK